MQLSILYVINSSMPCALATSHHESWTLSQTPSIWSATHFASTFIHTLAPQMAKSKLDTLEKLSEKIIIIKCINMTARTSARCLLKKSSILYSRRNGIEVFGHVKFICLQRAENWPRLLKSAWRIRHFMTSFFSMLRLIRRGVSIFIILIDWIFLKAISNTSFRLGEVWLELWWLPMNLFKCLHFN